MSQIPASLTFFTSQLPGLSRNNVKIQSQSATSMATNGSTMIRFAFPSASICDMASFCISGDVSTSGKAATGVGGADNNAVVALIPSGGLKAMVGRTAFSCGGVSLSNDVNYADVISRCKDNLECSISNACSDKRVMEAYEIRPVSTARVPPTATVGQDRRCVASNLLGFAQCHPRFLCQLPLLAGRTSPFSCRAEWTGTASPPTLIWGLHPLVLITQLSLDLSVPWPSQTSPLQSMSSVSPLAFMQRC